MHIAQHEHIIRERAYAIWEKEGRPDGREWDHWVQAATEMGGRPADATAPQPAVLKASGRNKTGSRGKLRLPLKQATL